MKEQKSLFPPEDKLPSQSAVKQGALFNTWLKEYIPDMKPPRYINIWKHIHRLAGSEEEVLKIEEYLKTTVEKEGRYNYYFVMYLLDIIEVEE